MVLVPIVLLVRVQLAPPELMVPVQLSVPSEKVMLPVALVSASVALTLYPWPVRLGSVPSVRELIEMLFFSTVWSTVVLSASVNTLLPTNLALIFFVPAEALVSEQLPVATLAVQLALPSLTVTLPETAPM